VQHPLQSHQQHSHWMQGPMERIEHEAEVLERHDAEENLGVVRFAKDVYKPLF